MAPKARMRQANKVNEAKVTKRGKIPTTLLPTNEDKAPVGPMLLALFIFVVCGSAVFEIVMKINQYAQG